MPIYLLVKVISVFKYEYAPTKAELRQAIGTRKKIRRPITENHKDNNVKKLKNLETVIHGLDEHNANGTLGTIDHQYFKRLDLPGGEHTYEDTWEELFFFVSSKYNIVIIGGGSKKIRLKALYILVEFLSGDISYLTPINIRTKEMLGLVNKIKTQGPKNHLEYKNIMTNATWKFSNINIHHGAEQEINDMHKDEIHGKCISQYPTFHNNLKDSNSFDPTMGIYRCNGILSELSNQRYYLYMWDDARFECTSDPHLYQWVIFVLETCKNALGLRINNFT